MIHSLVGRKLAIDEHLAIVPEGTIQLIPKIVGSIVAKLLVLLGWAKTDIPSVKSFIETVDKIIKLLRRLGAARKDLFEKLVKPLYADLQPVAQDYFAIFRKAHTWIPPEGSADLQPGPPRAFWSSYTTRTPGPYRKDPTQHRRFHRRG